MDQQRPTKKQKELLSFIDGFIKGNGYGPSYREIMRALDYKSVSTVATHIDGLIARGWLLKKDNSARTLEVRMPSATPTASNVTHTNDAAAAEKLIQQKIDELKQDDIEANATDIETLQSAMRILGFSKAQDEHLV